PILLCTCPRESRRALRHLRGDFQPSIPQRAQGERDHGSRRKIAFALPVVARVGVPSTAARVFPAILLLLNRFERALKRRANLAAQGGVVFHAVSLRERDRDQGLADRAASIGAPEIAVIRKLADDEG